MICKPRPTASSTVIPVVTLGAALLLCGTPRTVYGTTKNYVGVDNSSWNTAGNWSPSGVPVPGDDAILGTTTESASSNLDVTFNGNYSNNSLNSLTLNSSGLPDYMILNQTSSSSLMSAATENIGTSTSENTYNQSAGTNSAGTLNIGVNSSSNFYNLSGTGSLLSNQVNVGVSGTGVVNQSGGTVTLQSPSPTFAYYFLYLGVNAGGNGTYSLSGGTLTADVEFIGFAGTGVFNQTGGTNSVFMLTVGGGAQGGTGTYNLSGGTLSNYYSFAPPVTIQAGGTFNLLSGGSFPNEALDIQAGVLKFGGGSFGSASVVTQEGGAIQLNGYSATLYSLTATGGVISNGAAGNSTLTLAGTFTQSAAGTIQDGSNGKLGLNFTGTGTSVLTGTNSYTGSTAISAGVVQAGAITGISSGSAFVLSGGTLNLNGFTSTVGSLAGTGGTVSIGSTSLTAGADNTTTSYAGMLTGTGSFTKAGSGTLTLTGGGAFSGAINVQGGALTAGATNGIPTAATVSLANGTTLNVAASQTLASLTDGDLASVAFSNSATLTVGGNNADASVGTSFSGSGTLVKVGTGNLTLGFGSSDTFAANQDTGLAITENAGTLTLSKAAGTNAVGGALNINGGSVVLAGSNQIADASVVTLSAGTFNLAGFSETIGGLSGAGTVNLFGGTLTVAQSTTSTFTGNLLGPGAFIKSGTGTLTLTLTNTSSFGGTFTVNSGQLTLQGAAKGTGFTANSGGTLLLSGVTLNLGAGALLANAGGTVQYNNATISNGYLRGSGTQSLPSGETSTFNGITTYNSTVIAQNGPAFFNDFTNGGTLNNGATLTFNGGVNAGSGIINVNSTLNTQDFSSDGVMTIANGSTLSNTGSNLFLEGGSRTTINSGGTLATASGTSIELNGALLVNNGTQNGLLDVNYGSSAKGSGVFGTVNVTTGGKFGNNGVDTGGGTSAVAAFRRAPALSRTPTPFVGPQLSTAPGTITVGGMLLGAGSNLGINVQNATGAAGSGYDTFHDLGALTLTGASTPGNQIVISLASLNANGNPGAAQNFTPGQAYAFTLVTADGGITGYSAAEFAVDTSGFANALGGGSFAVAESGNDLLQLDFIAAGVPEPSTWIAGAMLSAVAVARWKRKLVRC